MDWAAIKKEYITTNISQRALSRKHGISARSITDRSKREGWVDLRRQNFDKTVAKTIERASDIAAEVNARLYKSANKALDRLDGMLDREEGSIKEITGALKDLKVVLDAKSEADMEEQRARIEKLRKEAQTETEQKTEITVRFEDME